VSNPLHQKPHKQQNKPVFFNTTFPWFMVYSGISHSACMHSARPANCNFLDINNVVLISDNCIWLAPVTPQAPCMPGNYWKAYKFGV
jgi:hypothetical protein